MSDAIRLSAPALRGTLRHDEPRAKHVTWRAGGKARAFFQPADIADLQAFLQTLRAGEPEEGQDAHRPHESAAKYFSQ